MIRRRTRTIALAQGEARYAHLYGIIASTPAISVATITLEGGPNSAPHPAPEANARKFPAGIGDWESFGSTP
jgi:hypothetical protein